MATVRVKQDEPQPNDNTDDAGGGDPGSDTSGSTQEGQDPIY
ncbi:MAG: hypothetical protein ACHQQQ_12525 [Bacteroidota bacterium]